MRKNERTVRYTAAEIDEMRRNDEDRTDLDRLDAMTEADVDAAIAREDEGAFDWGEARVGFPQPKQQLTVRFDRDVIEWFKAQGAGYQTRMNAVLRSFVEAQKR